MGKEGYVNTTDYLFYTE